ncbi:MAG: CapA family protein [Clostridia bacterium]|nr:CapA family protein [Clostridia bacterium]
MKTKVFLLFLLMMTLAAYGAAQMNFDIDSPYLTYTKLDSEDAPPVLIDVLGGEELPEGVEIIGGADGSTSIIVAEEDGPTSILLTDDYAGAEEEASWPRTFTITLAGDTTLGSTDSLRQREDCFENVAAEKGYGWFFSGLSDLFGSDDMTLVNFEGTLTEETKKKDKKFNFKGPAEYTDILTLGSVEAVTVANNHTLDYGEQGRKDTIENLENAGLTVSGNGQLGIFEKDGVKVGMTGYCFPYSNGKKDITKDVKALREAGCQIVIASFHWGSEYREDFTGEQRSIGRAAIKAGADFVVGHHPHIVQGIESYQDTYIAYSVGNLVFGGNVDPDDRDAAAIRLTFTVGEKKAEDMEMAIVPLRLTELADGTDYRPVVAEGEEAQRIVKRILRRSYKMENFENSEWQ